MHEVLISKTHESKAEARERVHLAARLSLTLPTEFERNLVRMRCGNRYILSFLHHPVGPEPSNGRQWTLHRMLLNACQTHQSLNAGP